MEANGVHFSRSHSNRKTISPDRKGGSSNHLGLRAVGRLSNWQKVPCGAETDHKPLVPILGSKNLEEMSPRIQRLRMRLLRFDFSVSHVPGKHLSTADALSRAPIVEETKENDPRPEEEVTYMFITYLTPSQLLTHSLSGLEKNKRKTKFARR